MAKDKTSFVLYSDSKSIIDLMTNEQAGLLLKTLFAYVNDENPTIDNSIAIVFEMIKLQLKRDLKKWEQTKEGRSIAGKASAEARKQAKLNEQTSTNSTNVNFVQQTSTNSTVSDSVSVSVSVSDSVINNINIPIWEDFLAYGKEKEPNIKVSALKNKYDAWVVNGWKNGNDKPIKNWKSALLQTLTYIEKNSVPKEEFKYSSNFQDPNKPIAL